MARAAYYFYEPDGRCALCDAAAHQTIQVMPYASDLDGPYVDVPCHRWCYVRLVVLCWVVLAMIAPLVAVTLAGVEASLMERPGAATRLPVGFIALDCLAGLIAGSYLALRLYSRLRKRLDRYVRSRTTPSDV